MTEHRPEPDVPLSGLIRIAAWLNRHWLNLGILLLTAAAAMVGTDLFWHWSHSVTPRVLQGFGKNLGALTLQGAILAVSYYLAREVILVLKQRQARLSEGLALLLRQLTILLRQLHPVVGMTVAILAVLHWYLMQAAVGRIPAFTLYTGLGALLFFVGIGCSGAMLRNHSTHTGRLVHRLFAAAFFLAVLLHKIYI